MPRTDPRRQEGMAIGKLLQMLKLGLHLIVMIRGRKHSENKKKAADVKRNCEHISEEAAEASL